jgi:hypothetical protein
MIIIMEPIHPSSHETRKPGEGDGVVDYFLLNHDSKATVDGEDAFVLPPSFLPGKRDVICQRGKECYDHSEFFDWSLRISRVRSLFQLDVVCRR